LFEIENTGKGLTPEQQKRIFERFYQIDPHAEGMGLGLSLVKELVEVLGGSISVESEQGKRTRFLVQIPLEKPAEIPEETPSPQPEQVSGDQPVLLILEDHPEVRLYIAGLFRDQYTVMEAASAAEAWEKAVQTLPNLIISDIMMPGEDGFSFCRRLKSDMRTAHIPLIFLTAKTEQADKQQAASCGAHDLVVKPFDEKVLKHKVQNLLDMLKRHRHRYRQEVFLTPKDLAITPLDEKFLEKMEKILEERLSDPAFGVDTLARTMHMSRMQLHRKIKALTGLPASDFLRSQRLKHAARILKTTDLSVNEIAYQSGFNNPSYFVRRFKQAYGMTPGEYRKKD
jgi:YesN/AraC family two-component response regulator